MKSFRWHAEGQDFKSADVIMHVTYDVLTNKKWDIFCHKSGESLNNVGNDCNPFLTNAYVPNDGGVNFGVVQ